MKEKELDFDELHQAVSQMMDSGGKQKTKREPVDTPKTSPRPPVKVAERPAATPTVQAANDSSTDRGESIAVRRPAATRITPKKRGMAMDVIQAVKPAAVTPPSNRPSRTGAALQPTGPIMPEPAPEPAIQAEATPSPDEVSEDTLASLDMQKDGIAKPKTVVEEPPKPHPAAKSTFPDPLDVHGFTDKDTQESAKSVTESPKADEPSAWDPLLDETPEPEPKESTEPQPETTAPELSASPFVNAKVEKRPLGAFAPQMPSAPPEPALPDTPAEPKPVDNAAADTPDAGWELPEQPVADTSAQPAATETIVDAPAAQAPLDHLRGTSIPPQYHATEKEPTKDDRPIFDTKNYHTPIEAHATPRRASGSHAGIILTIILIILLIAAGIAAYFVATGSIDLQKLL